MEMITTESYVWSLPNFDVMGNFQCQWNNKGVVEKEFGAEEHMNRYQKTRNNFAPRCQWKSTSAYLNDKQALKTIASKMSILR